MNKSAKSEDWKEWMQEFQGESDRGCALLGAAFLDEQLRSLLVAFLIDNPKRVDPMFEKNGPLSTFSARIDMAYALGFLSPLERADLDLVRRIRNEFAHELHGLSFASPSLADRCSALAANGLFNLDLFKDATPRNRFVVAVVQIANWIAIRRLSIRSGRRVEHGTVDATAIKESDVGA